MNDLVDHRRQRAWSVRLGCKGPFTLPVCEIIWILYVKKTLSFYENTRVMDASFVDSLSLLLLDLKAGISEFFGDVLMLLSAVTHVFEGEIQDTDEA